MEEAMLALSIPCLNGKLGIILDDTNNRVAALDPEAGALDAGLRVGDLVVAVDNHVVTALDGNTVMARRVPPIDPTQPSVDFTVLRLPEDLMQRVLAGESLLPPAPPETAASSTFLPPAPPAPPETAESMPVEDREAAYAAANAEALRNYPWAKEFVTSTGEVKTMYNVKHGTVLQPLPQVSASLDATRRKEAFANPRSTGSGTYNYLRVG